MGIFSYNIRSILEVKRKVNGQEEDLENEEQNNENNEPEQNDTSNNEPQETSNDTTAEENPESEEQEEDNTPANDYNIGDVQDDDLDDESTDGEDSDTQDENNDSESNDYSMGDVEEDNLDEDESSDDSESENSTEDTTNETEENELKSLENDIFKDIAPEQMNIKIIELKKQYLEVYATVTDVLTRTNKIPKTSQNMSVLEFITNKLMELKDIVQFYLANTFDTKTYVENMVNYQQYLATLNTINRLLKEISRKKENNT